MSLFRIIKATVPVSHNVEDFAYSSFQMGDEPLFCSLPESDFQPIYATAPFLPEEKAVADAVELLPAELPVVVQGPTAEELSQMVQDAYDKGFAEGRQQTEESFAGIFRTFSEAADALNGLRGRMIRESRDDILNLSMMVAKQIIHQEISQDRTILAQFVAEAVRGVTEQDDIVICFNPEDCKIVSANRHLYLEGVGDQRQVTIKPDESVSVGGCVVDTPTGMVDARVETQLAEIYKHLVMEGAHVHDEEIDFAEITDSAASGQSGE